MSRRGTRKRICWTIISDDFFKFQVDPTSTTSEVNFESNFMGSFCAGIFVPPNTIDFGYVIANFSELIKGNWQVLATMCVLVVLYILLLVWARRADIADKLRVIEN